MDKTHHDIEATERPSNINNTWIYKLSALLAGIGVFMSGVAALFACCKCTHIIHRDEGKQAEANPRYSRMHQSFSKQETAIPNSVSSKTFKFRVPLNGFFENNEGALTNNFVIAALEEMKKSEIVVSFDFSNTNEVPRAWKTISTEVKRVPIP